MYVDSRSPRRRAETSPVSMCPTAESGSPSSSATVPSHTCVSVPTHSPSAPDAAASGRAASNCSRARATSPVDSAASPMPDTALASAEVSPDRSALARARSHEVLAATTSSPANAIVARLSSARARTSSDISCRSTLSICRRPCRTWPRSHQYSHSDHPSRPAVSPSPVATARSSAAARFACAPSMRASHSICWARS